MQDTPGYCSNYNLEEHILRYIRERNQEYLNAEQDPERHLPLACLPDPRVDVCLFFLAPHRMKDRDLAFIRRLAPLVPVIPILAKVDPLAPLCLAIKLGSIQGAGVGA